MPERPDTRAQTYLLPPTLDDWVAADHPVRFVEAFVGSASPALQRALGLTGAAEVRGAPRYAPALLARVWVYGFMTGVPSARALEARCRDDIAYRWLTGNQCPDHTTLWRWYAEHRGAMRALLDESVQVAAQAGLISLTVLAVDGTKLQANAAADQMLTADELAALAVRTSQAIADLEAQNTGSDETNPPSLPPALRSATALRERITQAQAVVAERAAATGKAKSVGTPRASLTDPEARWMKTRTGKVPGYNAQIAVVELTARAQRMLGVGAPAGRLVVAAAVTTAPNDTAQLGEVVRQASRTLGVPPVVTVADAGYFSGGPLAQAAALGTRAIVPESDAGASQAPYHRAQFVHDLATDTLQCPQEQTLRRLNPTAGPECARRYGGIVTTCRVCPVVARCTRNTTAGRIVTISVADDAIQAHRALRRWAPHRILLARRKTLVEGVIGTLKTVLGGRQVQVRGRTKVEAQWQTRAVGFNLRVLRRVWTALPAERRGELIPVRA